MHGQFVENFSPCARLPLGLAMGTCIIAGAAILRFGRIDRKSTQEQQEHRDIMEPRCLEASPKTMAASGPGCRARGFALYSAWLTASSSAPPEKPVRWTRPPWMCRPQRHGLARPPIAPTAASRDTPRPCPRFVSGHSLTRPLCGKHRRYRAQPWRPFGCQLHHDHRKPQPARRNRFWFPARP